MVSSYILVFAGLMLAGGRLADLYGRRRLFLIGLSVCSPSPRWRPVWPEAAVC